MAQNELVVERLLRVIDEGSRSSTYKLALLLGLIDSLTELGPVNTIPTRIIAEKVTEIYYKQAETFYLGDQAIELKQITSNKATVIEFVNKFLNENDSTLRNSLMKSRKANPVGYEKLVDQVEDKFVRYPIPLLQKVGKQDLIFLYKIDWQQETGIRKLRKSGLDRLSLLDGVAEILIRLGPMFRSLIEIHWVRDVAKMNRLASTESELYGHLFGNERENFPDKMRKSLNELQSGKCFYCGYSINGKGEVDHFLPWSRKPNDSIENLVLADSKCNNSKSDFLVTRLILETWENRLKTQSSELRSIASESDWTSDLIKTRKIVCNIFNSVVEGTPLWAGKDSVSEFKFEVATGPFNLVWNEIGNSNQ
jgi:5-methylcytosine-specific restriction endonuclease McrA